MSVWSIKQHAIKRHVQTHSSISHNKIAFFSFFKAVILFKLEMWLRGRKLEQNCTAKESRNLRCHRTAMLKRWKLHAISRCNLRSTFNFSIVRSSEQNILDNGRGFVEFSLSHIDKCLRVFCNIIAKISAKSPLWSKVQSRKMFAAND